MCPAPSAGTIQRMPGQGKLCPKQSLVLAFHKVLCDVGASLLLGDPHAQMLTSPCSGTMLSEFPTEPGLVVPAGASLGKAVGAAGSPPDPLRQAWHPCPAMPVWGSQLPACGRESSPQHLTLSPVGPGQSCLQPCLSSAISPAPPLPSPSTVATARQH